MKEGTIIAVNYTGKSILTNEVFDTTYEKEAVKAGIFDKKQKYAPFAVIVGEEEMLKGLDSGLKEMKLGETRKIKLTPEHAFGSRKPENISVVPLQQFKKEKMQPVPGLPVEINGRRGKIQSVSGGRVRIDFNHPLAGKELEYELKIEKEFTDAKSQITALFDKYFSMVPEAEKSLKITKENAEVVLSPRWSANLGPLKTAFSKQITKFVKDIKSVRFIEEFKKENEKADKDKAPAKPKTEK